MKRILVLTGMGACQREPYQGQYVTNQVKALQKKPIFQSTIFTPKVKWHSTEAVQNT
jgi:hypothetical protein